MKVLRLDGFRPSPEPLDNAALIQAILELERIRRAPRSWLWRFFFG